MGRRRRRGGPTGIVLVDKPPQMTSHDVVAQLRRRFDTPAVGHCGTLDPDATGVLVLGVGRCTKLLHYLLHMDKDYVATIVLGTATDSLDASGTVVARAAMDHVRPADVVAAAASLTGTIEQVPPMVSAIRVDGRRLHELAREGIEVERAARPVTVHSFQVEPTTDPLRYTASVSCGSGTYIRVLADDLGRALGGYGHLDDLRRTRVGPFAVDECDVPESAPLREAIDGCRGWSRVSLDDAQVRDVAMGRMLSPDAIEGAPGAASAALAGVDASGRLVAVLEPHDKGLRPAVPFVGLGGDGGIEFL